MILRINEILWARLKINKSYGMFTFASMNTENAYYIQHMNAHANYKRQASVR